MSTRLSWSSAAIARSLSSAILPSASRRSLSTSVRKSESIWMICSSVSLILPRALAGAGGPARLEQLLLAGKRGRNGLLRGALEQILREGEAVGAIALRAQAALAGGQLVELRAHHAERRARHRIVEPHHNVAFLDDAAFAHQDIADDAAVRMLHLLDVRFDDDRARRDDGAGELAGGGPAADAEHQQRDDPKPREVEAPDGAARIVCGGPRV